MSKNEHLNQEENQTDEKPFNCLRHYENQDIFHPHYKPQLLKEKSLLSYSLRRPNDVSIQGYMEATIAITNHLSKMLKNANDFEDLKNELSAFVDERRTFANSNIILQRPFFVFTEDELAVIKSKINATRKANKPQ